MLSKLSPTFNPSDSYCFIILGFECYRRCSKRSVESRVYWGKTKAQEFIDNCIKQNNVGFYDTIEKNKLKTFIMKCSSDNIRER